MNSLKYFFSRWALHTVLWPVFFTLHTYKHYYGLVNANDAIQLLVQLMIFICLYFLFLRFLIKKNAHSAQLTSLTVVAVLFFGDIKDFARQTMQLVFITRYTVLLPLYLLILVILYVIILKRTSFNRVNLFLNTLLLIYICWDISALLFTQSDAFREQNILVRQTNIGAPVKVPLNKPDIYFLLFDCYPGTEFMLNYMKYDNAELDKALMNRRFRVVRHSTSNYNRTAFSLASELNFGYFKNITSATKIKPIHYNAARLTLQYAQVPAMLSNLGYATYNLSMFRLANNFPLFKINFLSLPARSVLLYNTLPGRLQADILWNLKASRYMHFFFSQAGKYEQAARVAAQAGIKDVNREIADSVPHIAHEHITKPKFVYAHFHLPHPPFFYSEDGKPNNMDSLASAQYFVGKSLFIPYLQYTNSVMLKMVDSILHNSPSPPVIIIQSDHGFTDFDECPSNPSLIFKNYSAFYFPDNHYAMLSDTLSNVNTFPIVFNKYFNTHIPLQKDSSFFLSY